MTAKSSSLAVGDGTADSVLKAQEKEIVRLSRLYAALSQVNRAIVRTPTHEELFCEVCKSLVEAGGFSLAWIGLNIPETHRLLPVADCGDGNDDIKNIEVYCDDRPAGCGPSGLAFRTARSCVCNDILNDPVMVPWRAEAERRGLRACAAFPIRFKDEVYGVLTVYSDQGGFFQDKEIALLSEVAADLSFGLENIAREAERRQVEAIAKNEKMFSDTMIESMPGVLYFYDHRGKFLRWNKNFESVSGYTAEEVARMHPLEFIAPEDKEAVQARIAEVFGRGESSLEALFLARDGRKTPYFFTGRRIFVNETACLVGMGIDLSELKRVELALRNLNETLERRVTERTSELQTALVRAEAADRLKSVFLATMSHELRTPLNSIIGFTGVILQGLAGPLNEEQTKQLGMVRVSARHLLELINDVLDLSKIEAGQLEVRAESFDVRASLNRVIALVKPLADKKGLVLETAFSSALTQMLSDRRRVEQILINLLNNAIKFTDHGSVTLSADATTPAFLRFRVEDTGIGIKAEDIQTLFQPFRQVETGIARQHEGSGLGLVICRRLAVLLGGQITAASEWGKGSIFTAILPSQIPPPP